MSRCFPFPPPGYSLNKGKDEALIESIKLQRERELTERELAKAERKKEKKREKKEKKKEKKRNESHSNHNGKDSKHEKSWEGQKGVYPQKLSADESEHLERSSVTEEHAQPSCLPRPSSSSDSTQNSSKRKRDTSPVVEQENVIRGHGNVIRIRLASQKKNKPVDALVRNDDPCSKKQKVVDATVRVEGPCSTPEQKSVDVSSRSEQPCITGTIQLPAQCKVQIASGHHRENNLLPYLPEPSLQSRVLSARHDEQLVCSTSGRTEPVLANDTNTVPVSKSKKKLSKAERKYRDLVENWVPPSVMEPDFEDEDWLLPKRDPVSRVERQPVADRAVSFCKGAADLWPRAQFLPEADIYALPFTVPF